LSHTSLDLDAVKCLLWFQERAKYLTVHGSTIEKFTKDPQNIVSGSLVHARRGSAL
jgi:hypothetical protein